MTTRAYFDRSRLQVIGLITAATVAVGALGGIAGIAFDADPVHSDPVPAVSDGATGSGGGQARLFIAQPAAPDGKFVKLRNGVRIFIPRGWRVYHKDSVNINFTDDNGSYAYAYSGGGYDPSSSAADVVFDNLDGILPPDSYTQRTVSDFMPWGEPFGTVLSVGWLEYHAVWVDNQGSQPIIGQIYAGVRQDGTVLIHLIEHLPPENFNAAYENVPIVWPTFERFGAAG